MRKSSRNVNLTVGEESALHVACDKLLEVHKSMNARADRDNKLALWVETTGRRLAKSLYRKGTIGHEKFE